MQMSNVCSHHIDFNCSNPILPTIFKRRCLGSNVLLYLISNPKNFPHSHAHYTLRTSRKYVNSPISRVNFFLPRTAYTHPREQETERERARAARKRTNSRRGNEICLVRQPASHARSLNGAWAERALQQQQQLSVNLKRYTGLESTSI